MIEKKVKDAVRNEATAEMFQWLEGMGYEPMYTAAGTLYYKRNDVWVKCGVIIPNASEEDGTDGYALAEEFQMKQEAAAERQAKAEKAKADKIAKAEAKKKKTEE